MHRLAILTAATLTLSATACGDNQYVSVEVDDDRTADFARATVDVAGRAISEDYVVPNSIFSYARARISDRVQWADDIGGLGYPGSLADLTNGERAGDHNFGIELVTWAPLAQCSGFSTAPGDDQRSEIGGDGLTHQAPEDATAAGGDDSLPGAGDVTTGEALSEDIACGTPIDNNDTDLDSVCQCADLDCVADYVNDLMGCNVCMTFVCGDDLLGACAECAP